MEKDETIEKKYEKDEKSLLEEMKSFFTREKKTKKAVLSKRRVSRKTRTRLSISVVLACGVALALGAWIVLMPMYWSVEPYCEGDCQETEEEPPVVDDSEYNAWWGNFWNYYYIFAAVFLAVSLANLFRDKK